MQAPPKAAAAGRNADAIVDILRREFAHCATVLEIGSGSGEHAVIAAAALDHLSWQPSDLAERLAGIRLQIQASAAGNVLEPILLDVNQASEPGVFDAVFTANTLHIVDEDGVAGLIDHAGRVLGPGGRFVSYGPFRRQGRFSTPSNAQFDASLRAQGGGMGVRDLETIASLCSREGLALSRSYAMPANNLMLVWEKSRG